MHLSTKIYEIEKSPIYFATNYIIGFVLDGSIDLSINIKKHTYFKGDVFFIESDTMYFMEGKAVVLMLAIDNALFTKYHLDYLRHIQLIPHLEENYAEKDVYLLYRDCLFLKDLLDSYAAFHTKDTQKRTIIEEKIITSLIYEYSNHSSFDLQSEQMKRYYRLINSIHQQYASKITLDELASEENILKTSLAANFKTLANSTILQKINEIRLIHALKELVFTDKTNDEISISCGFSDRKYFYRYFHEVYHMTPTKMREMLTAYKNEVRMRELTYSKALPFIEAQYKELEYIRQDTQLYQQYTLLKELEYEGADLSLYRVTLDLYNLNNSLLYQNKRYYTWHGLQLILRLVQTYHMPLTIVLNLSNISFEDEEELFGVMKQIMLRIKTKKNHSVSVQMMAYSSLDLEKAKRIKIRLFQELNIQADVCIL